MGGNMKTDARVRYTKKRIREAFFQLLSEKELARITVTEICDLAEINRTTFYKHYLDTSDLLEKIEAEILEQTQVQINRLHQQNTIQVIETLFDNLQKTQFHSVRIIFRADPKFSNRITEIICQECGVGFRNTSSYSSQEQAMIQRIMVYGYGSVIRNWLLSSSEDKMSPHQLADFLLHISQKITDYRK